MKRICLGSELELLGNWKEIPSGKMRAFTCTSMAWTTSVTGSIRRSTCGRSKQADARGRDGGVREELAAGVVLRSGGRFAFGAKRKTEPFRFRPRTTASSIL